MIEPMSEAWCRRAQETQEPKRPSLIAASWRAVLGVPRTPEEIQQRAEQEFGPPRRAEHA